MLDDVLVGTQLRFQGLHLLQLLLRGVQLLTVVPVLGGWFSVIINDVM